MAAGLQARYPENSGTSRRIQVPEPRHATKPSRTAKQGSHPMRSTRLLSADDIPLKPTPTEITPTTNSGSTHATPPTTRADLGGGRAVAARRQPVETEERVRKKSKRSSSGRFCAPSSTSLQMARIPTFWIWHPSIKRHSSNSRMLRISHAWWLGICRQNRA